MRAVKIPEFIAKWSAAQAAERANKDLFLTELCDVLGVPRPNPSTGDREKDTYVFERDALLPHEGGTVTVGRIDLYCAGRFILEAKQGSDNGAAKKGTAKRDTPAWNIAMRDAYGQALRYARSFETPVPFLVTCDIGYCFELYAAFDGSWDYRPFPTPQQSRVFLSDLEKHKDTLRAIFTEPFGLDPSKKAAKVTWIVAEHLAELAKTLEKAGHAPDSIATFLMRCLFTMFAEDVGLLPEAVFTKAIEQYWIPSPASFPGGIETLWRAMNEGTHFGFIGKLLRFNGGLFASPTALPLDKKGLSQLLEAAKCDWSGVEPAIFGTLLERALDSRERHRLGAHYTPRAYVERLVKPTIEAPLRAEWQVVQIQVRQLVGEAEAAKSDKASKAKVKDAAEVVKSFQKRLCTIRVLDPACGSGNFLYVTLDLFKRLEAEVLALLADLGDKQEFLALEGVRVTPAQFLGIEVKRWAKEIAELVLWIGYLQWHFRTYGRNLPVPEPVLRDYKNIECRDAVLAYDREELVRDEKGKPVTRWDGVTFKKSPVTGEDVPDEQAREPIYSYVNPRKAKWPEADFVVGNPPFLGKLKMLSALGDGYVAALRDVYAGSVEDGADYVLYWWQIAADKLRAGNLQRFGFVSTNSISQIFNRRVLQAHFNCTEPVHLTFAVPDHPWVDAETAADVRIALTVAAPGSGPGVLMRRKIGRSINDASDDAFEKVVGVLRADLTVGADVVGAVTLRANQGIASPGVEIHGKGFVLDSREAKALGYDAESASGAIREYRIGRDLTGKSRDLYVIDLDGMNLEEVRVQHPAIYQWVYDRVRPERMTNREAYRRENWWLFARRNVLLRSAIRGLPRYIGTVLTARHRVFTFLPARILPDQTIVAIGLSDGLSLGVLSSRVHVVWALAAGARLGIGNDPRYTKTRCLDPFPFPPRSKVVDDRVADLAEELDALRKAQMSKHPDLTITAMYNVLQKVKEEVELSDKDKLIHERGLVSVLKRIHDDLDAAVFDAYGWPHDLTDEQILEKLVALNAERVEEERNGHIRWLRPEFQNPGGATTATQVTISGGEEDEEPPQPTEPTKVAAWPKKLPDQIPMLRDLVGRTSSPWTATQAAAAFKGAKAKDVEPVLDSLAALGLVLAYDTKDGRRWRALNA